MLGLLKNVLVIAAVAMVSVWVSIAFMPTKELAANWPLTDNDNDLLISLDGKLAASNDLLSKSIPLHSDKLIGPEASIFHDGYIYTGLVTGEVVKVTEDSVEIIARFGDESCTSGMHCGRPLGIRIDKANNRLLVADAYHGIFGVSLAKGHITEKLFPLKEDDAERFKTSVFNDIELTKDGRELLISVSSVSHQLHELMHQYSLGRKDGMLIALDLQTNTYRIIKDKLFFSNGIHLLSDGKSVVLSETYMNRLWKISLDGSEQQILTKLPGMPDNITPSPRGGFWVGLAVTSHKSNPGIMHKFSKWPKLQYMLLSMLPLNVMSNWIVPRHVMCIRLSEDGTVLESWHGKNVPHLQVVGVEELNNGTAYLSSYNQPGLRKLDFLV